MVEGKPEIPPELAGYRDLGGADFRAASDAVLANLGTREQFEEMIQLVRDQIRMHEAGIARLRAYSQPNPETQPAVDAFADAQRRLAESQRHLGEENRALSADIKALIARLDEIIRDQNNGA
jgi:septation ring formation regulator EzrA